MYNLFIMIRRRRPVSVVAGRIIFRLHCTNCARTTTDLYTVYFVMTTLVRVMTVCTTYRARITTQPPTVESAIAKPLSLVNNENRARARPLRPLREAYLPPTPPRVHISRRPVCAFVCVRACVERCRPGFRVTSLPSWRIIWQKWPTAWTSICTPTIWNKTLLR